MPLNCLNPPDIPTPQTFTHVIAAAGTRLVFIAGQVAEDAHGNLVGAGDMAAQARQVFANIGRALAAAGARPEQVTKLGIFVANYRREHLAEIEQGRVGCSGITSRPTRWWAWRRCRGPTTCWRSTRSLSSTTGRR